LRSDPKNEPDAPRILEDLIRRAEAARASDIHLQRSGDGAEIWFRLDGQMTRSAPLAGPAAERVFGRIKFLARLKTYQESLPQDGRIDKGEVGASSDLRVSTYPTVTGEKIVLRLFGHTMTPNLGDLGFPDEVDLELKRVLAGTTGMLLLTGPAGSGKTTTIYACLRHLAGLGGRHIITIEDPVEQIVPGIMQTEVREAAGLDFARAARHLLRQDPQVLVIGEIRDVETAGLALRAALTGHLVIATLHAGSCRSVFDRLLLMCPEHYVVFAAVELVLNQRLIRRLCATCCGQGCDDCLQSGYQGRVPLVEWLRVDEPVRQTLRTRGTPGIQPRRTLEDAARRLVEQGVTNEAEYGRIFQS
jgi:general secretion pathway protein E